MIIALKGRHSLLSILNRIIHHTQLPARPRQRATSTRTLHKPAMTRQRPHRTSSRLTALHLNTKLRMLNNMIPSLPTPLSRKISFIRRQQNRIIRILRQKPGRQMLRNKIRLTMPRRHRNSQIVDRPITPQRMKTRNIHHRTRPIKIQTPIQQRHQPTIQLNNMRIPRSTRNMSRIINRRQQLQRLLKSLRIQRQLVTRSNPQILLRNSKKRPTRSRIHQNSSDATSITPSSDSNSNRRADNEACKSAILPNAFT